MAELFCFATPPALANLHNGGFDCVKDLQVPSAPAQIPGEPLADLVVARMRRAVQQCLRSENHAGGAIAALRPALFRESILKMMKFEIRLKSLDAEHISSVALNRQNKTGEHKFAIQNNCACSALA